MDEEGPKIIFAKLLSSLNDRLVAIKDTHDTRYDHLRLIANANLPQPLSLSTPFLDVCSSLQNTGILSHLDFKILLEMFPIEKDFDAHNMIRQAERDITDTKKVTSGKKQSSTYTNFAGSDIGTGSRASPSMNLRTDREQLEKVYRKTPDQKGFMAILIWTHTVGESDCDIANIVQFFKDTLKWDTETRMNLTEERLTAYLKDLQSHFKEKDVAKQYYCFGIAVIGHGQKGEIEVEKEKYYKIDELVGHFKNTNVSTLVGIPKFFLIEACRGDVQQRMVEKHRKPSQTSDMVENIKLPADSDIHIAYATTEGYVSHLNSIQGSWFLSAAMEEFTSNYKDCHMEEMLISVRQNVAARRSVNNPNAGQMPCSWSTFTKRLFFK